MKKSIIITLALGFCSLTYLIASNFRVSNEYPQDSPDTTVEPVNVDTLSSLSLLGDYVIHSPISSNNLQVFIISGKDELKDKKYVPLSVAMEKGLVKVNETGSVNNLTIDNKSDEYVFINSGDIVKGGKQDRTIGYDMIIAPNSRKVALQSFCVEQGRWRKRDKESVSNFESSTKMLSSRKLKMAAKYQSNQQAVWSNVAKQKDELNEKVSKMNGYVVNVSDVSSASSLQLALENEELDKAKSALKKELEDLLSNHPDAIGYAYSINGEIYGVDIYNNRELFNNLWERLMESVIVEAISEIDSLEFKPVGVNEVAKFITSVDKGEMIVSDKELNRITHFQTRENTTNDVVFTTIDKEQENWIHKNYIKKDTVSEVRESDSSSIYQIYRSIDGNYELRE